MISDTALVLSDDNLVYADQPRIGIPILLVKGQVAPLESMWLLVLAVHGPAALNTVLAYASAIEMFRRSVDEAKISYKEVREYHLISWRDTQIRTGLSGKSVNLRLTAVLRFLNWCYEKQLIDRKPPRLIGYRTQVATYSSTGFTQITIVKAREKRVRNKTYTITQFAKIRADNPRIDANLRKRDDCCFRWGWSAGLRCGDIVGLKTQNLSMALECGHTDYRALLETLNDCDKQVFIVSLDAETTKGSKGGDILVPRSVLKATLEWGLHGRNLIVSKYKKCEELRSKNHVFIGRTGYPVPSKTLTRTFLKSSSTAKLPGGIHKTRHSFGTRLISLAEQLGVKDGKRVAKELLRHNDDRTTEIYQHMIEERANRVIMMMLVTNLDIGHGDDEEVI